MERRCAGMLEKLKMVLTLVSILSSRYNTASILSVLSINFEIQKQALKRSASRSCSQVQNCNNFIFGQNDDKHMYTQSRTPKIIPKTHFSCVCSCFWHALCIARKFEFMQCLLTCQKHHLLYILWLKKYTSGSAV